MSHNTHSTVGQNAGCAGLRIADRGLRIDRPPIRNPNSEIRNRAPRPGISLTEVLIAMGILTVGLLGVASIFPVASFYMQKGDVADRGSAIAQAAFNEALARGVFDPAKWYAMTPSGADPPNYSLASDGTRGMFTRNVPEAIAAARAAWPTQALCQRVGQVFVIDPLGAAAMSNELSPGNFDVGARSFPASAATINLGYYFSPAWDQWLSTNRSIFPVRRVTMREPRIGTLPPTTTLEPWRSTQTQSAVVADRLFSSSDDLAIEVPPQSGRPSVQRLMTASIPGNPGVGPIARQSRGDYSWIATVVPSDPWKLEGSPAEVSVVVFYKRQLFNSTESKTQDDLMQAAGTERMVKAGVVSTGLSGGELLLNAVNDGITESPFRSLKVGQWVMLCGPAPSTTTNQPQFVARWYRVLSIEPEGTNVRVAVRGPAWPWQPENGANALSNNLCVGIFPGAVAVHSKTIRLGDNSAWSIQ